MRTGEWMWIGRDSRGSTEWRTSEDKGATQWGEFTFTISHLANTFLQSDLCCHTRAFGADWDLLEPLVQFVFTGVEAGFQTQVRPKGLYLRPPEHGG